MFGEIEICPQTLLTTVHSIMNTIVKTYILNQENIEYAILIIVAKSR
jgi:hypothetical protein